MTKKFPFWVPGKKEVPANRKEEVRQKSRIGNRSLALCMVCWLYPTGCWKVSTVV
jgi:hypothetical protein